MQGRSKRARKSDAKSSSTSSVLVALNGSSNHSAQPAAEKHESIAKEITQIAALDAQLATLNADDIKLVASLMAVLEEETKHLNHTAEKRYV